MLYTYIKRADRCPHRLRVMSKAVTATAENTTISRVAYSATYQVVPCEGGIVTFLTWEDRNEWYESFGRYCYDVVFH
jgi:hypothetical protein